MGCKNKKCKKACGSEEAVNLDLLGINYSGLMRICKVVITVLVFCISSFQWGVTGDVLWQCIWSLSLLKLVELN